MNSSFVVEVGKEKGPSGEEKNPDSWIGSGANCDDQREGEKRLVHALPLFEVVERR